MTHSTSTGNGSPVSSGAVIISDQLKTWRGVVDSNDGRGDFTQADGAAHLGVPRKTYIDWEQGRHGPRGLALETVLQRIKSKPSKSTKNPAGAVLKSNRERQRPTAQSPSPPASGARTKRVTHAKKTTRKKSDTERRKRIAANLRARWKARRHR